MIRKIIPVAMVAIGMSAFAAGPIHLGDVPIVSGQAAHAAGDSRDAYMKEREGQFEEWGRKVDSFGDTTKEKSKEAARAAERNLDKAWAEVKTNWQALKQASKETWQEAKKTFEDSWKRLEKAWDDAQKSG